MYCLLLIIFVSFFIVYKRMKKSKNCVCIVVLGDIGRSPRMQYHALSLAKHNIQVDFIGYGGSKLHSDIINNSKINCYFMKEPPLLIQAFPKLIFYLVKVLWQSVLLFLYLLIQSKPSHILLQNPPCLPTIAICWLVCLIEGCHLVVDWHNYGYTILGLTLGVKHPLVRFTKWYEQTFGRLSKHNICVTEAMKHDLKNKWGISAATMYDRPPLKFNVASKVDQHKLFRKLLEDYTVFRKRTESDINGAVETRFTKQLPNGDYEKLTDRPALLVSSTSWTEDEDFSILLQALQDYEVYKEETNINLPKLVCVITGKGPLKSFYKEKISKLSLNHIEVCTPWLEAEDYPTLIGSADLGICLHTSSSGLDLPMKVVDMFGCGLPVCAIHFNCLSELVKDKHNGRIFHSSSELASLIQELLTGFPGESTQLEKYRKNLDSFKKLRWDQEWDECVWPIFQN